MNLFFYTFYFFAGDTQNTGWCKGWYSHLLRREGAGIYAATYFRLTAMGMDSQKSHYDTSSNDNQTSASEILLYYAKFLMFHLHILDLMCPGISFCFSLLPSPLSIEEEYNLCLINLITFIMRCSYWRLHKWLMSM